MSNKVPPMGIVQDMIRRWNAHVTEIYELKKQLAFLDHMEEEKTVSEVIIKSTIDNGPYRNPGAFQFNLVGTIRNMVIAHRRNELTESLRITQLKADDIERKIATITT